MKRLAAQRDSKIIAEQKQEKARAQGTDRLTVLEAYEAQLERDRIKKEKASVRKSLLEVTAKPTVLSVVEQQA